MAYDAFLEIEGIDGESTSANHPRWIVVDSYTFGVQTSPASSGAAPGRPAFTDVNLSIRQSTASIPLAMAVATGRLLPRAQLAVTQQVGAERPANYYTVTLEDVFVTSYFQGGASGDRPNDTCSLTFSRITWSYRPQLADGSLGTEVTGGYDVALGTPT